MEDYSDDNENYRMSGRLHEVRVYDSVLKDDEIAQHVAARQPALPPHAERQESFQLATGPWLQFIAPGQAIVRWRTERPGIATR